MENRLTYDVPGHLTQVDDQQENATWVYEYDQGGNILSKKKYAYGVTAGEPNESKTFTYGNAKWKDQLTAVNGVNITYDAIGNPLNDGTWTYTWQNGRQLASMSKSGTTASFKYNENGLRVQKTVNGVTTDYTLHGKNIIHMKQGSNNLHFFYDAQNCPAVVVYNGTAYSYAKSLQGDIVAILNNTGTAVVQYVYDAWGHPIMRSNELCENIADGLKQVKRNSDFFANRTLRTSFGIQSRLRPDAIDRANRIIYELKPYNKESFLQAIDQIQGYLETMPIDKKDFNVVIDLYIVE